MTIDIEELKRLAEAAGGTYVERHPSSQSYFAFSEQELANLVSALRKELEEARFGADVYRQIMDVALRYGRAQVAVEWVGNEMLPLIYAAGSGLHEPMRADAEEIARLRRELEEARKERDAAEWEGYINGLIYAGNMKSRIHRGDEGSRVLNDIREQIDAAIDAAHKQEPT